MESAEFEWESLIAKKLSGKLSTEEDLLFERKIKDDPLAFRQFKEMETVWKSANSLQINRGRSREERWHNLQAKVSVASPPKSSSHAIVFRYAAALIGIVLLACVWFLLKPTSIVEITTVQGEIRKILLPDNSSVTLNAETTISYDPSSWENERKIELKGEAFFNVTKATSPFRVNVGNAIVKVLGTSFNVRARDHGTNVSCVHGRVNVSDKQSANNSVVLTKGLGVSVRGDKLSDVYVIQKEEAISWVRGDLYFNDLPLNEVFNELERHFGKEIRIQKNLDGKTFTGKFRAPRFSTSLQTVCLSAGLTFTVTADSTVIVR
ncbi:MAG TPA: FecR domain-containing protein [Ohtaekwangia sp.]|nr:FecR domain-containing protein [Ohtaekwangia sp.]